MGVETKKKRQRKEGLREEMKRYGWRSLIQWVVIGGGGGGEKMDAVQDERRWETTDEEWW